MSFKARIFDINKVIEKLKNKRKIFCSEADFQLEMAWTIKEIYRDAEVRMEFCPEFKSNMHIDIVVFFKDKWIPIELKYKTKACSKNSSQIFELKNQSAKPQNCYKYLWDIHRIEQVREKKKKDFLEGYAIFLTNDLSYRDCNGKNCSYEKFAISEGELKKGKMNWAQNTGDGTKKGCKKEIKLKDKYTMNWKKFSCFSDVNNGEFIYLLNKIEGKKSMSLK